MGRPTNRDPAPALYLPHPGTNAENSCSPNPAVLVFRFRQQISTASLRHVYPFNRAGSASETNRRENCGTNVVPRNDVSRPNRNESKKRIGNEQKKYDRSDRQPAGLLGTGACQHQNATDALRHASGSEENRAKLGRGRPRTDRRTGCHRDQSGHQQHGQPRITPLDYLT